MKLQYTVHSWYRSFLYSVVFQIFQVVYPVTQGDANTQIYCRAAARWKSILRHHENTFGYTYRKKKVKDSTELTCLLGAPMGNMDPLNGCTKKKAETWLEPCEQQTNRKLCHFRKRLIENRLSTFLQVYINKRCFFAIMRVFLSLHKSAACCWKNVYIKFIGPIHHIDMDQHLI